MFKRSKETLVSEIPSTKLEASVIVPVRNEEELLPSALQSLAEQRTLDGGRLSPERYEVILLINNTTDRSRHIAESFQHLYPEFRLHVAERHLGKSKAHIGYVRRILMDEACRRLETVGHASAAILSTDGDTRVAPNWIAQNQEELARGAQAVGGRIVIPGCEQGDLAPATQALYRLDHVYRRLVSWMEDRFDSATHDPWPRHHHHFGASLAITPYAYKLAGRLPPRRQLEDCAFYDALIRHDIRVRHSNQVRVFTSARLKGRTRAGLANQLREWAANEKTSIRIQVETAAFLKHIFTTRHNLRRTWCDFRSTRELSNDLAKELSSEIGLSAARITSEIRTARYFGVLLENLKFYENCRCMWPEWVRLAPLNEVVEQLFAAFREDQRNRRVPARPREALLARVLQQNASRD